MYIHARLSFRLGKKKKDFSLVDSFSPLRLVWKTDDGDDSRRRATIAYGHGKCRHLHKRPLYLVSVLLSRNTATLLFLPQKME